MKTPAPWKTGYAVRPSATYGSWPGNRTALVAPSHVGAISEASYLFAPRPYSLDQYSELRQRPRAELFRLAGEGRLVAFAALLGNPDFDSIHLGYWLTESQSQHSMSRNDMLLRMIGGLTMAADSKPRWTPAVAHALRIFATEIGFPSVLYLRALSVLGPLVMLAAHSAFAINEVQILLDTLSMHHAEDVFIPHLPALAAIANGKMHVRDDTPLVWNETVDSRRKLLRLHLLALADHYEHLRLPIATAFDIPPKAVHTAYNEILGTPPNLSVESWLWLLAFNPVNIGDFGSRIYYI